MRPAPAAAARPDTPPPPRGLLLRVAHGKRHHCASRAGGRASQNRCTMMRPARGRARGPVSARLQRIERLCAHGSGAAAAQARAAGERTLHKQGYRTLPHHTGHGSRARQATIRAKAAHLTSAEITSRQITSRHEGRAGLVQDAQTLKGKEYVLRATERGAQAGRVCSMGCSMGGQCTCSSVMTCAVDRRLSSCASTPTARLSACACASWYCNRRPTACKRAAPRQARVLSHALRGRSD